MNQRPLAPEASALPSCATPRLNYSEQPRHEAWAAPGACLPTAMRSPFRIPLSACRVVLDPAVLGCIPGALRAVPAVLAVLLALLVGHGVSPPLTSESLRTGCEMAQNHVLSSRKPECLSGVGTGRLELPTSRSPSVRPAKLGHIPSTVSSPIRRPPPVSSHFRGRHLLSRPEAIHHPGVATPSFRRTSG